MLYIVLSQLCSKCIEKYQQRNRPRGTVLRLDGGNMRQFCAFPTSPQPLPLLFCNTFKSFYMEQDKKKLCESPLTLTFPISILSHFTISFAFSYKCYVAVGAVSTR